MQVPAIYPAFQGNTESTGQRGFGIRQYAEVCHKLMLRLGYTQYVTQGGDWGYFITRAMGMSPLISEFTV